MNEQLKKLYEMDKDNYVVLDQDGKVYSYYYDYDEGRGKTDFIDTVDKPDGGLEEAIIFTTPNRAKKYFRKERNMNLDDTYQVLPVRKAFHFLLEEDSSCTKVSKALSKNRVIPHRKEIMDMLPEGYDLSYDYNNRVYSLEDTNTGRLVFKGKYPQLKQRLTNISTSAKSNFTADDVRILTQAVNIVLDYMDLHKELMQGYDKNSPEYEGHKKNYDFALDTADKLNDITELIEEII